MSPTIQVRLDAEERALLGRYMGTNNVSTSQAIRMLIREIGKAENESLLSAAHAQAVAEGMREGHGKWREALERARKEVA